MLLGTHHSIHFLLLISLHWVEVCVWTVGIEDFVAVHDGNEVLGVGEVDDVVGVAREHDDGLNLIARDFILYDTILANSDVVGFRWFQSFRRFHVRIFGAKLNESMTADYDEGLPLAVMPMLALGDSWLGDVDAHLAMREGVEEFGE